MIYFYSSPNILDINLCIQLTHNYRHSIKMLLLATSMSRVHRHHKYVTASDHKIDSGPRVIHRDCDCALGRSGLKSCCKLLTDLRSVEFCYFRVNNIAMVKN